MSTGATKLDVVVPVLGIVPVAIGGPEILWIVVVPRTAPIRPLSLLIMTDKPVTFKPDINNG